MKMVETSLFCWLSVVQYLNLEIGSTALQIQLAVKCGK